jgi:hypothetical protein
VEGPLTETVTGIAGAIFSAASFIRDTLLKKGELVSKEIEANIVPLNDEFLKIHHGYVRMFNLLMKEVTSIQIRALQHQIDASAVNELMEKAVGEFRVARDDIEGIRDTFRDKIAALVKVCTSDESRRYLAALVAYIVNREDEISSKEEGMITHLVEVFNRKGGQGINTPSIKLLNRISDERDPSEALIIIQEALAGLSLKESSVLESYFRLRVKHL